MAEKLEMFVRPGTKLWMNTTVICFPTIPSFLSLKQPEKQLMGLEQKKKKKTISTSGICYVVAIMAIIAFVLSTYVL